MFCKSIKTIANSLLVDMARCFTATVLSVLVLLFTLSASAVSAACNVDNCVACYQGLSLVCETCKAGYVPLNYGITCALSNTTSTNSPATTTPTSTTTPTPTTTTTVDPLTKCWVDNCEKCDDFIRTKCIACKSGYKPTNYGSICTKVTQGVASAAGAGAVALLAAVAAIAAAAY